MNAGPTSRNCLTDGSNNFEDHSKHLPVKPYPISKERELVIVFLPARIESQEIQQLFFLTWGKVLISGHRCGLYCSLNYYTKAEKAVHLHQMKPQRCSGTTAPSMFPGNSGLSSLPNMRKCCIFKLLNSLADRSHLISDATTPSLTMNSSYIWHCFSTCIIPMYNFRLFFKLEWLPTVQLSSLHPIYLDLFPGDNHREG